MNPVNAWMPCGSKMKYATFDLAHLDLLDIKKKTKKYGHGRYSREDIKRLAVYPCPHCAFWHLGRGDHKKSASFANPLVQPATI